MKLFVIFILGAILAIRHDYGTTYFLSVLGLLFLIQVIIHIVPEWFRKNTTPFPYDQYNWQCSDCHEGPEVCPSCPHRKWGKDKK